MFRKIKLLSLVASLVVPAIASQSIAAAKPNQQLAKIADDYFE